MHEGKVIVNCSGKHVQLKEEKWTDDYASMMTGETTEFIKTNEIWTINWLLTSFFLLFLSSIKTYSILQIN